ncbi:hypothetical protein GXM_03727 [Nostoc sphaeroides CCNUC1]|uniref:Uncharacterized protein n=1 Tax=Nostoc sphaeroides CCNUC1 TaxID=2653204 RepID=A0A5P8W0L6_9NOSO|nr:hypothetical protein GXM_03727 [Nostoc sphaeroides CCNUC1]
MVLFGFVQKVKLIELIINIFYFFRFFDLLVSIKLYSEKRCL